MKLSHTTGIVIVFALVFSPFAIGVETTYEFQITSDFHDQRTPAIYGDIVVWQDTRNGNWDIYGYNLSIKEEFKIITDLGSQKNPAIYGDIVVWEERQDGKYALYGYNLLTEELFEIATSSREISHPAIYEDIVVWEDERAGDPGILGYNLSTGQLFQLTPDPDEQEGPAIYGDIVVWEDERNHVDAIYGYSFSEGREFQVSTKGLFDFLTYFQHDPAIYGTIVIWRQDTSSNIYGYDLSTSEKLRIAAARMGKCNGSSSWGERPLRPAIYGDYVIWVDCRNGNEDIYGFNLSKDQEVVITDEENCQQFPAIYGDIVVWQDYRNGNWDIYGYNLDSPLQVVQFKSRTRLFFFDLLSVLIVVVPIVLVVFWSGRVLYSIKKFEDISQSISVSIAEPQDFRRSYISAAIPSLVGGLSVVVGILSFQMGLLHGFLCLFFSVAYFIHTFWGRRVPYIRIIDKKIMFMKDVGKKPEIVDLNAVQKIHAETWTKIPSRVDLILSDGKSIRIDMSDIHGKDIEDLICLLTRFVTHTENT